MARSAWKQQEITARGADLLRIARKLILKHGVHGLTMERLAAATPYSKGTIYQHFRSREDMLAALCVSMGELRLNMFERASRFAGRSRERAIAAHKGHSLLFHLHRELWQAEQLISEIHLRARLSPEYREAYDAINGRCFGTYMGILRDGMAAGELVPPYGLGPEQLLIGMVGSVRGLYGIWASDSPMQAWVNDSTDLHFKLVNAFFDGFGWRPFSSEWDYAKTAERVRTEVFPEEYKQLESVGVKGGTVTAPRAPAPAGP
jgi:AcrR family transcriptional regulator